MNFKKILSSIMSCICVLALAGNAWAGELEDRLEQLKQQAQEQQEVTRAAEARVDSISERLRIIQRDLAAAQAEYEQVYGQLTDLQQQIEENKLLLEKTEEDLKNKNKILQRRIKDIYINGQVSYVDVLFGATDIADLMTRMDVLKRIIKHDYDLITKVKQEKMLIMETKTALEKDEAEVKVLVAEAEVKYDAVQEKKEAQQALLDQAVYDRDTSEQVYEELMAASRQVANMIRRSQSSSGGSGYVAGSGSMIWPLDGPVTSEFGWRIHPIFGTSRFHSGLDIGGEYGMNVYAAADGTVIHAGWISGYGNTVILDHGGGITSLYAHNDSLNVGVGDYIGQGQVIAFCGSTGNSTGPHCHFEVRENGEPVSPYNYL